MVLWIINQGSQGKFANAISVDLDKLIEKTYELSTETVWNL